MTKLYVAGPMRGIPYFNFPEFDRVALELRKRGGYLVFNPADRDRRVHGEKVNDSPTGDLKDVTSSGFSLREALAADTAWICSHADGIALLEGWERSMGAKAEVALAAALSLPIKMWEDWLA